MNFKNPIRNSRTKPLLTQSFVYIYSIKSTLSRAEHQRIVSAEFGKKNKPKIKTKNNVS